ncbi:hypothetical protein HMPREF1981_02820 [Bacteroides pyogenes F0041]|uniref:Uncharacterized protein n=1 Tax=Bacteroides pyogenes F0041 TaxID=1321819 RepID=U2CCY3_9BACE|nr:hypothetical protein HMPREF1981_02820 [Bacteroides pyogenes F0041]
MFKVSLCFSFGRKSKYISQTIKLFHEKLSLKMQFRLYNSEYL